MKALLEKRYMLRREGVLIGKVVVQTTKMLKRQRIEAKAGEME